MSVASAVAGLLTPRRRYLAAISVPVLVGWLYDRTQGYGAAVIIAAGVNVLGVIIAVRLPPRRTPAAHVQRGLTAAS